MLKFGQVINLETLERKSVNKPAEELKEKLAREDKTRMKEIEQMEDEVKTIKKQYAEAVRQNTHLLQRLAELTSEQNTLESALDLSQHTIVSRLPLLS